MCSSLSRFSFDLIRKYLPENFDIYLIFVPPKLIEENTNKMVKKVYVPISKFSNLEIGYLKIKIISYTWTGLFLFTFETVLILTYCQYCHHNES